jgi:hypothetical protein
MKFSSLVTVGSYLGYGISLQSTLYLHRIPSPQPTIVIPNAEVTVSVPAMMSVGEGDGMVQVCATLSAVNDTERDFTIALATGDGSGMAKLEYRGQGQASKP